MESFIASLLFVVLAEMGDKTQLLAMAFATKYKAYKVLIAILIATLLNHSLAVIAGRLLATVIPIDIISLVAALSFIIFGLWTIRGDQLEDEDKRESRFGPIVTVGIAFFLAEMGDKTQLATISLAVEYKSAFYVLMGTTTGMIIADSVGIIIGIVMHKHIPEKVIKWIAAAIFVLFGLSGVYKVLIERLNPVYVLMIIIIICICTAYAAYYLTRLNRPPQGGK
jgi:putative Ca2+/H+ antiporter (TMEM165/GDT1 family)